MRQVRIVIRYYDERGEIVFEGPPTLGHAYRVPRRWIRWAIYWDEALVESGECRPGEVSEPQAAGTSPGRRRQTDAPARPGPYSRPASPHGTLRTWAPFAVA